MTPYDIPRSHHQTLSRKDIKKRVSTARRTPLHLTMEEFFKDLHAEDCNALKDMSFRYWTENQKYGFFSSIPVTFAIGLMCANACFPHQEIPDFIVNRIIEMQSKKADTNPDANPTIDMFRQKLDVYRQSFKFIIDTVTADHQIGDWNLQSDFGQQETRESDDEDSIF